MSCDDARLVIILKALIIIGVIVEYLLGKRDDGKSHSGVDVVLNSTRTALVYVIFLIIAVVIRFKEWRNKNGK